MALLQNLNFLTNDLCRLGVKSQKHRLSREDVVQLQTLVDNLKTLTKSALAQTRREEDFEEELPSQSSYSLSSSPPSSTTSPTQPLGPGFLSSTISALSIKNPHLACTLPHSSFKRRNRGRNFPRDIKRECTICKTDKTSQWRSGADGRPTLCNACGLRYRHSMKQHQQFLDSKSHHRNERPAAEEPLSSSTSSPHRSSIYNLLN